MIKEDKKTNYYFLLKYLAAVTAVATATIAATTLKYSTTALTIPPIIVFPFIQPLIIAAVTLALIAYTMTCLYCNNNNTSIYTTTPSAYNNYGYGSLFWRSYDGYTSYKHGGSMHDHSGSMHDHGTQSSIHRHQ